MKTHKPTTPSRRHMTHISYREVLDRVEPLKSQMKKLKTHAGRNNQGRIMVRHQGGGNKKLYRVVDFKQNKMNVKGHVEAIEYDPYRSAFIARVVYEDGDRRYILAPQGLKRNDTIMTSEKAPLEVGNRMPLQAITLGTLVHNVELRPGKGGQLARSAGSSVEVLAHADGYTDLRMGSKEVRKVLSSGLATIGQVSNPDYNLVNIGKAGKSRGLGIRPTVRGSVMNPVDHPYGGGEGRQPRGTKRPKTMWGKVTGGRKTRHPKKWSTKFILTRRPKIR